MIFREGFWASLHATPVTDGEKVPLALPVHTSTPWTGKRRFQRALAKAENLASLNEFITVYRGWSHCRCCGKPNGAAEFQVPFEGGHAWHWPIGLSHYIEVHNVRPSQAFIDFIESYKNLPSPAASNSGEET